MLRAFFRLRLVTVVNEMLMIIRSVACYILKPVLKQVEVVGSVDKKTSVSKIAVSDFSSVSSNPISSRISTNSG